MHICLDALEWLIDGCWIFPSLPFIRFDGFRRVSFESCACTPKSWCQCAAYVALPCERLLGQTCIRRGLASSCCVGWVDGRP